jgi:cupin 2 domain-containing protein
MKLNYLLTHIPSNLPAELTELLLQSPNLRIERIISQGHTSPEGFWYDQDTDEWVLLVQGAARLRFEEGVVEMRVGDYLHIPAHRRHRVEWTDPVQKTVWVAVHF